MLAKRHGAVGHGAARDATPGDTWFIHTAGTTPFGHALDATPPGVSPKAGGRCARFVRTPFPGTTTSPPTWCRRRHSRAQGDRLAQCHAATPSTDISSRPPGSAITGAGVKLAHAGCWCSTRCAFCGDCRRAQGAGADGILLLGPQRPHPRLSPTRVRPHYAQHRPAVHAQAGHAYARALHYLKAVKERGAAAAMADGAAVAVARNEGPADQCTDACRRRRSVRPPGAKIPTRSITSR